MADTYHAEVTGNLLTAADQETKLSRVSETARGVWGGS
jgi:hypothetical protein